MVERKWLVLRQAAHARPHLLGRRAQQLEYSAPNSLDRLAKTRLEFIQFHKFVFTKHHRLLNYTVPIPFLPQLLR
jgi:hypothetical protein